MDFGVDECPGDKCKLVEGVWRDWLWEEPVEILVGLGETCEGHDESTGKPFPSCRDGLECQQDPSSDMTTIPGAENTCQLAYKGPGKEP